jgi:serine/threonine protein kinase
MHCVEARALFEDERNVYVEYELVIGSNGFNKVKGILDHHGLSKEEKAQELIDVCNGMLSATYALHRDGYLHRDIHLGNFIYADEGHTCLTDLPTMTRASRDTDFHQERYRLGINLRWIYREAESRGIVIPQILEMAQYHEAHRETDMPFIPSQR